MNNPSKTLLGITLAITVFTSQGCVLLAGAAVGGAGYAYATGALTKNLDQQTEYIYQASIRAMEVLDAYVVTAESFPAYAKIHAEDLDGRTIRINISALTERASKITIRVGNFGNEQYSEQILNLIKDELYR